MEVLDRMGAQDVAERREALAGAAWAEGVAGDLERSAELLGELDRLTATEPPDDLLTHYIEHARGQALTRAGRFGEVYGHARLAGEAAERAGRPDLAYGPWLNGAGAAICAGDLLLALELIERGLQAVAGRSIVQPEVHLRAGRTTVLLLLGRIDEPRTQAELERELADRTPDPGLRAVADHDRGMVALAAREHEAAAELLAQALVVPAR